MKYMLAGRQALAMSELSACMTALSQLSIHHFEQGVNHFQASTGECDCRCQRVAEALECGIVWKNCSQPCFCNVPW